MAVISVDKHWNGSSGSRTKGGKREYTAVYKVVTDSALDQVATICDHFQNAGNLPYLGTPYQYANDNDPNAICVGIDPHREDKSAFQWTVSLKYETETGDKKDDDNNRQEKDPNGKLTSDPSQWRESWRVGQTQITVPVEEAVFQGGMFGPSAMKLPVGTKTPVVNSAFEPFIPPPEKEIDIAVYQREYYAIGLFSDEVVNQYQNRVNKNPIKFIRSEIGLDLNIAPYTCRIKSIGGTLEWINNLPWWRVSIEFWVNPLGWRKQIVDMGLNKSTVVGYPNQFAAEYVEGDIVSGRVRAERLLDQSGNPITEPVLFNGAGEPLVTSDSAPTPVYLTYSVYEEIDIPIRLFGA